MVQNAEQDPPYQNLISVNFVGKRISNTTVDGVVNAEAAALALEDIEQNAQRLNCSEVNAKNVDGPEMLQVLTSIICMERNSRLAMLQIGHGNSSKRNSANASCFVAIAMLFNIPETATSTLCS